MNKDNIKTYPKKIYLQSEENEPYPNDSEMEITWCAHEVNNNDIKYIRADLFSAPDVDAFNEEISKWQGLCTKQKFVGAENERLKKEIVILDKLVKAAEEVLTNETLEPHNTDEPFDAGYESALESCKDILRKPLADFKRAKESLPTFEDMRGILKKGESDEH